MTYRALESITDPEHRARVEKAWREADDRRFRRESFFLTARYRDEDDMGEPEPVTPKALRVGSCVVCGKPSEYDTCHHCDDIDMHRGMM